MEMKGRTIQDWLHIDGDVVRTKRQPPEWIAIGSDTAKSAPVKGWRPTPICTMLGDGG